MRPIRLILPGVLALVPFLSRGEEPDTWLGSIRSTAEGKQYVNTGIAPKSGTKVELDFAFLEAVDSSTEVSVAGVVCDKGTVCPAGVIRGRGAVQAHFANDTTRSGETAFLGVQARYRTVTTFVTKGNTFEQNGVQLADPSEIAARRRFGYQTVPDCTGYPIFLCAHNKKGTAAGFAKIALYGAKIWLMESGAWVLKRDFRPCMKDGRAGLYDTVSKTIFYSGSSVDFDSDIHFVYPTEKGGVSPGQQIVNAVKNAITNDTIVFKSGTYTFAETEGMGTLGSDKLRLDLAVTNLHFQSEDTTSRRTWTQGNEPVIVNVNGGRFAVVSAPGVTFTGLTFTGADQQAGWLVPGGVIGVNGGGVTVSNCVFRQNSAWQGGACGGWGGSYRDCLFSGNSARVETNQSSGGALYRAEEVVDCDFIGNHSQAAGAILDGRLIENCTFRGNVGWHNGYSCGAVLIAATRSEIRNSLFECNTNVSDKTGGILRFEPASYETALSMGYACLVSNCTFRANYAKSYNGTAYGLVRSGASSTGDTSCRSLLVLEDCGFYDNWNNGGFGGALWAATARRCVFRGNHGHGAATVNYIYGDSAGACDLFDCDFSDGEICSGSSLTRCTIHDVTNRAAFYGGAACHATNCLIRTCRPLWAVVYDQKSAEFVNCTFAHNKIASGRYNYVYEYSYNTTNINCVYFSNTNASGQAFSVGVHDNTDKSTIVFRNCALGPNKQTGLKYDAACFDFTNALFCADLSPNMPAYEPRSNSPLKDRGDNSLGGFTSDDLDLGGRPRLNGALDVGAYESWMKGAGLVFTIGR